MEVVKSFKVEKAISDKIEMLAKIEGRSFSKQLIVILREYISSKGL